MLTKTRLPLLIALVIALELLILGWSAWTSTFEPGNFFAIQSPFIFDKAARIAARISSVILLVLLVMVGRIGLKSIYADNKRKEGFLVLLTVFTCNHLVHLMFVLLRFYSHGESLLLSGPINIGGTIHGIITFASIISIPVILWRYQRLTTFLYSVIILHLFNISSFVIKTFSGKVKPPEHPAYHNQFGIVVISAACLYILYKVYLEHSRNEATLRS